MDYRTAYTLCWQRIMDEHPGKTPEQVFTPKCRGGLGMRPHDRVKQDFPELYAATWERKRR